jgi:UDP-N-acetylmuramoyl-tripeptide--D-alanyl-D-alanine ligase
MIGPHLTLGEIARAVSGTLFGDASILIREVTVDSRERTDGGLFIAINGDRFDGHDFATMAVAGGAQAVLVHKQIDGLMVPHIRVADTVEALQTLGAWKRKTFSGKVAGITGSCGKTTTRRMLTQILSGVCPTHGPIKNFNNHIGVPLTLLGLRDYHRAAVLELGCSDFGEIAALTRMADPDVALVTNVGAAHLEKLGSLAGVARAKSELFTGMRSNTIAVVNRDDPLVNAMPIVSEKQIRYGEAAEADVRLLHREGLGIDGQRLTLSIFKEERSVTLPLLGAHNAFNALAASAAAAAMAVPIESIAAGLAAVTPEPGRLCVTQGEQMAVIDDTYNANPNSMAAALLTLKEAGASRQTVAVLGDMLELGEESETAHLGVGRMVPRSGIDLLVTLGHRGVLIGQGAMDAGFPAKRLLVAADQRHAAQLVLERYEKGAVVLVKGSRGMAMERVVEGLLRG